MMHRALGALVLRNARLLATAALTLAVCAGPAVAAGTTAAAAASGVAAHTVDSQQAKLAAIYADLEHADFVAEGPKQPKAIVYVLMDPNCIYCNYTWRALQPYLKAGLQVRWLPLGFLKPDSVGKAAAIFEAKSPADALQKNESGFDVSKEIGGIPALAKPSAASLAKLKANSDLMTRLGGGGTPGIIWKQADGTVKFGDGMPTLSQWPQITGLPAQTETDPRLEQFK